MNANSSINLIGAGLAGSLMTVYLAQKGYQVNVYEKRPDMRIDDLDGGRSINLALSTRGIYALRETGLVDQIMDIAIPMYGRMMHSLEGKLTFQSYSRDQSNSIYSVSRAELNRTLMNLAESFDTVNFKFDQTCEDFDFHTGKLTFVDNHTGEKTFIKNGVTLGSDGAFSSVRYSMQKIPRFDLSQSFLQHGYKELTIPAGPNGEFLLDKNALHIWPRGNYMMIALPNLDASFTCTFFFPFEGEYSFESINTEEKVLDFFSTQFPDAVPLMPNLAKDYFENPTGSLVTIKCYPWVWQDKAALIGDASHAIVPFFGQGMNAAFEDCSVLNECIERYAPDWEKVFYTYQKTQKTNADAIADMALENFIEMRDKVADEKFLFRKKVEHLIGRNFPNYFSRYEMVSFSKIPYREAYKKGEMNQKILSRLMEDISTPEETDLALAEKLIEEYLGE